MYQRNGLFVYFFFFFQSKEISMQACRLSFGHKLPPVKYWILLMFFRDKIQFQFAGSLLKIVGTSLPILDSTPFRYWESPPSPSTVDAKSQSKEIVCIGQTSELNNSKKKNECNICRWLAICFDWIWTFQISFDWPICPSPSDGCLWIFHIGQTIIEFDFLIWSSHERI